MDYKFDLNAKSKYFFQTIYQSALNFGGNEDQAKPILKKMEILKLLVED
jgi:hypothetical protein